MNHSLTLLGLDGSNPLAFLAALGTLRSLSLCERTQEVRMYWKEIDGAWRPILSSEGVSLDEEKVIELLSDFLASPPQLQLLEEIGPNLTISGRRLRHLARESVRTCSESGRPDDFSTEPQRPASDFAAAFGCDILTADGDPDSQMEDTALRTMSGAGHQHFIAFMRELINSTTGDHLRVALFTAWQYQDAGRGANLRWDPADDRRYALRWSNPSSDPNRTMRGANRLAIEALPLFTTAPTSWGLGTAGFTQRRGEGTRWTWPIWTGALGTASCRSLLQSSELSPPPRKGTPRVFQTWRENLARRGVAAVFQSQRITTGKFRNFTPARAL